ncbi:MAG: HU family DNA-binding protein [Paludibacteraceae bacterium]|nr:HU family DNA-binding protein [Paludibacteraceae bacterium]
MDNNKKLNLSDFSVSIAKKTGMPTATVRAFLASVGPQLEAALASDGMVRISGLGTFRLVRVDSRRSVDVNTGRDITIDEYTKVSFTPETSVKAFINQPFAHFSPVSVSDDAVATDSSESSTNTTENATEDPIERLNRQAEEIKDILTLINGTGTDTQKTGETEVQEDTEVENTAEKTEEDHVEPVPETPQEGQTETIEEEPVKTDTMMTLPATEPEQTTTTLPPPPPTTSEEKPQKKEKSWWQLAGIITLVILSIGLLLYVFLQYRIAKWTEEYFGGKKNKTEQVIKQEQPTESVVPIQTADTAAVDTAHIATAATDAPPLTGTEQTAREIVPTYDDIITVEQIQEGIRLVWLAKKYYGSKDFWVYIYDANRDVISNYDNIAIGTRVKIPRLPQSLVNPDDPQCIRRARQIAEQYKQH